MLFQEMKKLIEEGKPDDAIFLALDGRVGEADSDKLFHYLGDAFRKKSDLRLAERFYRAAIAKNPDRVWTLNNLGVTLESLGSDESLHFFRRAVALSDADYFLKNLASSAFLNAQEKREKMLYLMERDQNIIFRDWNISGLFKKGMRGDLEDIMINRGACWFQERGPKYNRLFKKFSTLANKVVAKKVVKSLGIRTAEVYCAGDLDIVLENARSHERYVLKPEIGESSNGILLISGGFDLLSRRLLKSASDIKKYYLDRNIKIEGGTFVLEEMIVDYGLQDDPYLMIPRDFKCFASRGRLLWTNVYNRNSELPSGRTVAGYSRDWRRIGKTTSSYIEGKGIPVPPKYDQLVEVVERLSQLFPYFMRFDFYIDNDGPVFGEFTHTSSLGRHQTEFGERTQLQVFFAHPDPVVPIHDDHLIPDL